MSVFFINTNAAQNGQNNHNEWLERGVIVTDGGDQFRNALTRPKQGDKILVYANGIGVVSIAIAGNPVITTHLHPPGRITHRETPEHHRPAEHIHDLRQNPISVDEIRQVLGYNPIQTFQQVRRNLPQLLEYLQERNLL